MVGTWGGPSSRGRPASPRTPATRASSSSLWSSTTTTQGCAITGGHVYRGKAIPEIRGHYFYGDWCTGFIRSFRIAGGEAVDQRDWTEQLGAVVGVNAFGIDSDGELYLVSHDGAIRKLVPIR